MGQYWKVVNLDKREFIHPHELGAGLKLGEQLAAHPATGTALLILCAAMPEGRGGGDLDIDENWHGPERDMSNPRYYGSPGPMPSDYPAIARRTIGRWAGDRVAVIGDYAEDSDLPAEFQASQIYSRCSEGYGEDEGEDIANRYINITSDVCRIIEHELNGTFTGSGWRKFVSLRQSIEA